MDYNDFMKFKSEREKRNCIDLSKYPKLVDAQKAGIDGHECTLILTEGDSAKSVALQGLKFMYEEHPQKIGKYGVYPLRGKLPNVRACNERILRRNQEISNLMEIIGLRYGEEYKTKEDLKKLRYGCVLIMTDNDVDGIHIKSLIINFFHYFWKDLLDLEGFIREFNLPLIKAKEINTKIVMNFFSFSDYKEWERKENRKKFEINYSKSIGSHNTEEIKKYFQNFEVYQNIFKREASSLELTKKMNIIFGRNSSSSFNLIRKNWIFSYKEGEHINRKKGYVTFGEFFDIELIQFYIKDLKRSIPNIMDGLKVPQRQILYGCLQNAISETKSMTLSQLSGYITMSSGYKYGEYSLNSNIIKLAQNFVGSNNINILEPIGMFGTRLMGGLDYTSPFYISTKLNSITKSIFMEEDQVILENNEFSNEPKYYIPIIPMVLVNGAKGIGVSYSTNIPCFNPRDVVTNIKRILKNEMPQEMFPWYNGFNGIIKKSINKKGDYESVGTYKKISDNSYLISELPVEVWTENYKTFLGKLENSGVISGFLQNHTKEISFTIFANNEQIKMIEVTGFEEVFKLKTVISTRNLTLFTHEGKIKKYKNANDILIEFCKKRIEFFEKRRKNMINNLPIEIEVLKNKKKFLEAICDGNLKLEGEDLVKELKKMDYLQYTPNKEYEYLLSFPVHSITKDKIKELNNKIEGKKKKTFRKEKQICF